MNKLRAAPLIVLALLSACVGRNPSAPRAGPSPSPSVAGQSDQGARGPIEFVLEDSYEVSERIDVKVTNNGERSYRYNSSGYEACNLTYRDETGREFKIPPGTHCDIIIMKDLAPGETVKLFTWELDECLKDQWGCVEEAPLPPGTYTIEGTFRSADASGPAHATTSFEIVSG